MQAEGQRFESVILHHPQMRNRKEGIDILEARYATANAYRRHEQKKKPNRATGRPMDPNPWGVVTRKTKERRQGHMKDALALGGEEGRDKLR